MHPLREFTEADLRHRTSVKWSQYPEDVLPLWIAEMDARPPAAVSEALGELVARGDAGYGVVGPYREAFAEFARRRWQWAVTDDAVIEVADVLTGLATAIRLVTEPGAAVVVNPPVYPPFYEVIEWAGRRVETAPLGRDGRLDLDRLDEVLAGLGPGAAHLLCSPHNPTGAVHTRDELEAVARISAERGARVVVDEIHAPLVPHGFVPYLAVRGSASAFVATSASKAFNLAGLKAGLLIAGADAVHELAAIPPVVTFGASQFGLVAQTAALTDGDAWLDAVVADLTENRRLLRELLDEHLPDVGWAGGDGCYLAWLDFGGLFGDDPAAPILERGRVALSSGLSFGPGGERHARLNYATTPELLERAVRGIARIRR
ncbi:aminotransferase class I/II-fold pyridoxal phosphate-dependent enzyme [Aeromicrobium sp. PE09-221]|uniref:MalY/PatB family protein n=1 Tax=Aeromicrobium sp. PE09-221 TaxID=1898043 RepID=UPI00191C7BE2|nr:aminotransferase class I/II-fold pyridoxal phosphate-dependent enzyme [Aeromicrobium sp. PE09-221]